MEEAAALAAEWSRTAADALAELAATAATPAAHASAQQRAVEYALPQLEIGWNDVALVSATMGDSGIGLCPQPQPLPLSTLQSHSHPHSLTLVSLVSLRLSMLRVHLVPLVCDDVQHAAAAADALEKR